MEVPAAYIPIDRRQALAAGRELPEREEGAALFADISGFTALTETLARTLGPKRGAEELTIHLNSVYDALIAEVDRFGGSVISFGGDAITCWFDGHGDAGPLRAVACALAMQRAMARFSSVHVSGEGRVALAVKAAVAHGPVRRFVVGDPGYSLIDVMAGSTLERLVAAEARAKQGELVLHGSTAGLIGDRAVIGEWRADSHSGDRFATVTALAGEVPESPWPPIPDAALSENQIRPWLLPQVYRRLAEAQGSFLAELRPAAALFLRFGGLDYDDDPSAPQTLDTFIRQIQQVLAHHDGSLLQLLIGDKGSYLYAAFGAPNAHEDDVARAASAALGIQALPLPSAFRDSLQIGIAYGRMRVGAYGSRSRRTYGALGDAVNLSARLMQAARPGEVLASDDARAHAGGMFSWEALPAIQVKGRSEPVVAHRLLKLRAGGVGPALDTMFPAPAVGRREIFAALEASLSRTLGGKGEVARLIGEAGTGKSHSAAHFSRLARDRGARIALGICQSMTRNAPYTPWRQALPALLGVAGAPPEEALSRLIALAESRDRSWTLRLPVLGDALGLTIPENPTTAAFSSELRQKALFSLVAEMVRFAAEEHPLVVILDDVQWMDEPSLALTLALARRTAGSARVMFLLLQRPAQGEDGSALDQLSGSAHFSDLSLGGMSDEDALACMEQLLGGPATPLLLSVTTELTRGNPFFIGEMLAAMRQSGQIRLDESTGWCLSDPVIDLLRKADALTQTEGRWELKPGVSLSAIKLGIPDSVHGLVLSRLDRLPEAHKVTLKVGSVVGHTIDLDLLSAVHPEGRSAHELEEDLESMARDGWLRREGVTAGVYAFGHHTTHQVAYDTLLFSQRREIHEGLARTLAARRPDAVSDIANHAVLGEVWPLALRYNTLAGERARQLFANQQSLDFYQKASLSAGSITDQDTSEPRKRIHLALGELLVSTGQSESARQNLEAALSLAKAQGDWESQARCCRWFGSSYEVRGEYAQALDWLEAGIKALDGRLSVEGPELSLVAGLINFRQGRYAEALESCERGIILGEALDDRSIRARAYNLKGVIELRRDAAAAIEHFRQSLSQYERLENLHGRATSHNLIANAYFALCDWSRADAEYRRALDLSAQLGDIYLQVLVESNLGGVALKQERFHSALGHYEKAARLLGQMGGSLFGYGGIHLNMGHVYIRLGHYDEALSELRTSQGYLEQAKIQEFDPELYGLFAEATWLKGNLEAAEEYGRRSVDLARQLSMPREEGHNLRILGEVARARGQQETAADLFRTSLAALVNAGDEEETARTTLALARIQADRGEIDAALEGLRGCEAVFERRNEQAELAAARDLRRRIEGQGPTG